MNVLRRLFRTWQNLGITAKFALSFALLFSMILVEAAVSLLALGDVRRAEAVILSSVEIRQRVFEMDGQLEKARRLHRDFFLQYPHIGFLAAQELYFKPSTEIITDVVAASEDLKRLIEASNVSETLRERNNDLTLYLTTARRFSDIFRELVSLVTVLAAPGTGLESQLNEIEAELENHANRSSATLLNFREMALHHRQYMVTRQRPYMQSAMNSCFELGTGLAANGGQARPDWPAVHRLLTQYAEIARQIPDVDVSIRSKLNDFTLQAKSVDPISANLKVLATAEVERARHRIAVASRVATAVILATAITGLGFVLLVAAIIHASVTRKLVALTSAAEQMRAGHLEAEVESDSCDEVGVLAASFKEMAARMQQLVGNLEHMVLVRTAELTDARDRLEGLVVELDEKNHALEILSVTDRLTGLANRRKLEASLQSELLRARRYGKTFSVIMLDVDRFKTINDTHGHQTGDTVLVQLAELLRRNARETDIVGRWGGEEFLIICPETNLMLVTALAERYRLEMERNDFGHVGQVTSSFGVTSTQDGDDVESLVRRADEALYRAKEFGRNRVETDKLRALH
ncbi:MAG TPA: diguanylate cyclase [Humidesulfovibrio sp.]|uniref:GGDEF domain-containing protein n=1 Tax=Humidesulfovibrio sp. TaxID=2910988 RepID=UPI002CC58FBF|nr:diguanylate cyclase [Humidesulfovibrio sp.]HWR03346.1 diguanylate cyclase [Humidesulfovibrio sp.]